MMEKFSLGTFIIDQPQSQVFSETSGDRNPLHLNPIIARRYQFGSTVIHGVSGTLMALDLFAKKQNSDWKINTISVQYSKPIRQGDVVDVFCTPLKESNFRIELYCQGKRSQLIKLNILSGITNRLYIVKQVTDVSLCEHLTLAEAIDVNSTISLVWDQELIAQLFPHLLNHIPHQQISIIMGLTNIVGMKCPGLNSVFGGFDLNFKVDVSEYSNELDYHVISSDERFSRILIAVSHPMVEGKIEALFRADPIKQPGFDKIKSFVDTISAVQSFEGEKILVVGGSRGIGEIAAKLLAARNADVIVTYTKGQQEAQQVVDEINSLEGKARSLKLDVLNLDDELKRSLINENITQIYYFASPLIEKSNSITFNFKLFERFCQFYLEGFTDLINIFMSDKKMRKQGLKVFVPSTTFINEQPEGFGEYISAKVAVETFAKQFTKKNPTWAIHTPRLPRVPTDQTAAIAKEDPMMTVELLSNLLMER